MKQLSIIRHIAHCIMCTQKLRGITNLVRVPKQKNIDGKTAIQSISQQSATISPKISWHSVRTTGQGRTNRQHGDVSYRPVLTLQVTDRRPATAAAADAVAVVTDDATMTSLAVACCSVLLGRHAVLLASVLVMTLTGAGQL